MAPLSRSLFSLLSFRSFRSFPAALLLSLLAFLALIALPRASRAADIVPPFPDGCVAAIADSDLAATRAVYAALPKGVFFWHDGMSKPGFFDADRNVSYCCIDQASGSGSGSSPPGVVAPPSESSPPPRCDLACPIQCTPDGRITSIISDPSLEDMPGGPGRGGSCPLGALSPAIGDLSELSSLVFRHSCLAGELPDSVTRLQKLTVLDMRDNSFSGSIPPGLFRLPALRHLHLSANGGGLSGSLPEGPGAYSTSLETVDLAGNALSGELPRTLFRAPALRWADLQSNNLTGELPGQAEAGGAGAYSASLVALILRNNSLSGGLPTELAEMTRLKMLDLGGNRLSGAVPQALGALLPAVLDVVRLDGNALTGPLCHALLPARDLALGFNPHLGGDSGEGGKGSLHGCVLPAKLEELSAPHAGLWGSVPPDLFLAVDPQTGRRPAMGGLGKVIELNFSRNSLSGSLSAFSVLPSGTLDLSYNNFTGGIPEAFFSFDRRVDVRFNALSGPLYDARRRKFEDRRFEKGTDVWDYLRVSNNSAAIARAVGAGYLPAPSPGVQASAAETAVLLAVRDALLGGPAEAAEGVDGGALADGGNSSWAALLSGWGVGTSSACAWYGVGCTADGHVDTLHLLGDETVTLHAPFVPDSPECEDVYGEKICAHDPPPPPPPVRFFLQGLPGRKSTGSLSTALGQLTRLTSLRISHHTLSSSLPASLSLLSHLVSLDLSSNRLLSGAVPPTLYTLPELRELTLRGNNLTGDALPSSGAAALSPSLESLDVGGDQLSGSIGSSIGALTSLTRLALDHNRLQGSLPGQLCALWMLRDLQLQGNALQGDLSALAAATSGSSSRMWGLGGVFPLLTLLDVSSNQLSGDAAVLAPIGSQFSYLNASHNHLTCSPGSALWTAWHVDLSHNRISAALDDLVSFPDSFAYVLRLAHNQISGPIPASLLRHTVSEELDLSHNLLSGTIPQIVNYYSMTTLDLSYNQLSGAIPDIDGSLRRCDFSHNQLTGGVPQVPPALEHLNASWNQLTKISSSPFRSAEHLESLDISHNAFSGVLPALGVEPRLTRLTYLDLSFNAFNGSVSQQHFPLPAAAAGACKTVPHGAEVRLSHNALTGNISGSVFSPCLALLDLSHNHLSGAIPPPPQQSDQSPSLLPLSHLDLSSNKLTGSISTALVASFPALNRLDVSNNLLSGSLPPSLALAPALTHLDLSRNKLKGSLPALCQGQQRLATLLLSSNAFSGSVSSLLSSCAPCTSSLLSLNISSNQLSGPLPASLSRFTALQSLVAARNRMIGSIPAGVASLKALQALDLSWNGLSGAIPALLRAAAPSLHVQLAGNALSGSVPKPLSDLPLSCFRPGNPKLCGTPLPACKTSKPRKGGW